MTLGYRYLLHLRNSLTPNQQIGCKYHFVKWLRNGNLQFRINENQNKSIPAELIMLAYHIHVRNARIERPIIINIQWLRSNGHTDWCFINVLNCLLNNYSIN